jgi:hypothetical protein
VQSNKILNGARIVIEHELRWAGATGGPGEF